MWLVMCSSTDPSGPWVYQGLRELGVAPLELVLAEWLACANEWEHRVAGNDTHLKITLPDGRVLCSSRIRGAINRLLAAPGIGQRAAASDRDYAQAELQAFYLSWLKGLPGVVINRPTATGMCGSWFHISEWVQRASRAGLRVPVYRQTAYDAPERCFRSLAPEAARKQNLIAFRGEVFGASVPLSVAGACGQLARDAEAEILGIELYESGGGEWTFSNASPCPDLTAGGPGLLERLAEVLMEGERP